LRFDQAKRDYYRRRAQEEGYRSRAAFKLKQMNEKYQFIKPGSIVADIGAAPGGWLEVSAEVVGNRGRVIGIDLLPIDPLTKKNVILLQLDITSPESLERLDESINKGKFDCVLADLSPKLSGIWDMDHYKQIELCHRVLDLLPSILATGGSTVMKAFQGEHTSSLIPRLKTSFQRFEISKPDASRKESSEVYLVAMGFNGQVSPRQSEDTREEHRFEEHSGSDESDSL